MIDEMHVVHAGRAGRHAREARKAPVDVLDDLGGRRALLLQHVLDQVNAAARAIEFVAEKDIGRAGRGAKAAMHAFADHRFRTGHGRIGKRRLGEFSLHGRYPPKRPVSKMPSGSNARRTRASSRTEEHTSELPSLMRTSY